MGKVTFDLICFWITLLISVSLFAQGISGAKEESKIPSRETERQTFVEKDPLTFFEVYDNNEAAEYIVEEKPERTFGEISKLLEKRPENMLLHYNLGVSLMHLKDIERSKQEFAAILKSSENPEIRFYSAFNLGYIFSLEGKIDKAVENYQIALDHKPDSKETKVNIELLFQAQSGGGGGGESEKEDKENDESGDQQEENPQKYDDNKDKKPRPKEFKSKELTRQDVKDILEELEQQEQQIRDKLNQKKSKEKNLEKDW